GTDVIKNFAYYLEVTPTGTRLSTAQGIVYVIVLIASVFILLLSLYGALKIPWENPRDEYGWTVQVSDLKYVKLFLWFASYLILLWMMFIARNISQSFLYMDFAGGLFSIVFNFMIAFTLPLFLGSLLFGLIYKINDVKIQKALQRGLPVK
ncbi:unnamed protein product, partial [marine sediment metagenome]